MIDLDVPFRDKATVLVVDDEPDILWAVRDALTAMRISCVCVGSAAEALAMAEQNSSIRILLSDVRMPNHDGPWLIAKLAEMRQGAGHPLAFIMMSDASFPSFNAQSDGVRAAGLLPKPFGARELRDALIRAWAILQSHNG